MPDAAAPDWTLGLPPFGRVRGVSESGPTDAVWITDWPASLDATFVPLVAGALGSGVPLRVCAGDDPVRVDGARAALVRGGVDADAPEWWTCGLDSIWMRDYGPLVSVDDAGRAVFGDAAYTFPRPADDAFPVQVAGWEGAPVYEVPLALEGGNLLRDGSTCITSTRVADQAGSTEGAITDLLSVYLGCERTIVLEPLDGEPTEHVDLFVLLAAPGVAVVGSYDPGVDARNAEVLDAAASDLEAAGFRVTRAPMPGHHDGSGDGVDDWRTHLNAVPLGTTGPTRVLVPVFADDRSAEEQAFTVIEAAFPGALLVPVESGPTVALGGAVHCVTSVTPRLDPIEAPVGCGLVGPVDGWLVVTALLALGARSR